MQVAVTFMQRFEEKSEAILKKAGLLQPICLADCKGFWRGEYAH
jgi:hypothetical protein